MIDLKKCTGSGLPARELPECSVCGARFWLGMNGSACGTIPAHAQRHEPSARYYPRVADMHDNTFCHAAAMHGMLEEQAIDLLAIENRDLRARLMRAMEMVPPPMVIVREAPKRLTVPDVIERFRAYHNVHLAWGSLHVVLDDYNINDDSVRGCVVYAQQTGDVEGEALARILLSMSKTQRRKISRLA